jgi:hypothetical protein
MINCIRSKIHFVSLGSRLPVLRIKLHHRTLKFFPYSLILSSYVSEPCLNLPLEDHPDFRHPLTRRRRRDRSWRMVLRNWSIFAASQEPRRCSLSTRYVLASIAGALRMYISCTCCNAPTLFSRSYRAFSSLHFAASSRSVSLDPSF